MGGGPSDRGWIGDWGGGGGGVEQPSAAALRCTSHKGFEGWPSPRRRQDPSPPPVHSLLCKQGHARTHCHCKQGHTRTNTDTLPCSRRRTRREGQLRTQRAQRHERALRQEEGAALGLRQQHRPRPPGPQPRHGAQQRGLATAAGPHDEQRLACESSGAGRRRPGVRMCVDGGSGKDGRLYTPHARARAGRHNGRARWVGQWQWHAAWCAAARPVPDCPAHPTARLTARLTVCPWRWCGT